MGRLKTGTPPRIDKKSIDFANCRVDSGDSNPIPFSKTTISVENKISCYVTNTNSETHEILKTGFDRSPMFSEELRERVQDIVHQ